MNIIIPTLIMSALGIVFGIGLAVASKAFGVEADGRIALVREALPGANCAACGYTGCDGYAEAVVSGEAKPNKCSVGGPDCAARIAAIMGVEAGAMERMVARVRCAGTAGACKTKYDYQGIEDCAAAKLMHDGPSACSYGCAGFGSCAKACNFGAIYMEDGVARVIASKCTACGMCVAACPKRLIALEPADANFTVCCANRDKGMYVRRSCTAGCIGCMRCAKACLVQAITVTDSLASIDMGKCRRCGECMKVCPQKCIRYFDCALTR
ncbi:MAG: RnfABCDGE type electron transport complex subunit B [Clostridiales bacterium]|jgi:RnfABCDGE-type electron transport complex B subunit|nr:RnfABCDGE type electron transport complex subunit B [Clostridiales bacterium]